MLTTQHIRIETKPGLTASVRRLSARLATATATALLAMMALAACADEAPASRFEMRALEQDGTHWTISGLDASIEHEQIEAIATFVEARTKAEGVMVSVMKSDAGDATLMISLAGEGVNDEGLEAAVRAQFPALSGAKFARTTGPAPDIGPMPPLPSLPDLTFVEHDKEAAPEELEAEIRDALSAHGVAGDVDVKVEGDGRQREVRVEVRQEAKMPIPPPTK